MDKKIVLTVFVLVLLSSSMLGTGLAATVSALTTHHVYQGQSIQKAMNLVQSGDVTSDVTEVNKTKSIEPSVWVSPDGSLPTMFNETERSYNPFSVELKYQTGEAPSPNMVYVLVDSLIYEEIEASLVRYVTDIETSGLSISVYSGIWGTPEETRTFLQQEFSSNLTGCLLVGDIPEVWYEIDSDELGHEEFPTDLYYMDLDGNWTDSDVDGIYDGHEGDVAPEVWVGRLKASTIEGDEASLLNNYFNKNHRYRTGTLSVPQCALVYVDDDWDYLADGDKSALGQIYEQTLLVKDRATTNAEDYLDRLPRGYEWVHLRCHGSTRSHRFKIPEDQWDGTVYSGDYRSIDPPVLFYQLFVCSAARYTQYDYLGGTCIFTDTGGLLAIGSTKAGGMLYFNDFYGPLSEGDNIGGAFKEWFIKHGVTDPKWFYGLTILGDPLLKPLMSPPSHDLSILELEISPYPEPGAPVFVNTTVFNMGTNDETNITVQLLVDGSVVDSVLIDSLGIGTSATVSYTWSPAAEGINNVSCYVVPVPGETLLNNNIFSETVSVQVLPEIIIVADNDAHSVIKGTSVQEFEWSLTAGGYDYIVWYESTMSKPPLGFLIKFKCVIWTCGDYLDEAVDPVDAATLESYLAQGGNILLEGEDIGYDHYADSFMVNVAHAIYQVDNTGAPGLTVTVPTHPVTQGLPANFAWLTDPLYDDGVTPTNGGFEVIRYTDTSWTAVTVYDGTGNSNGSVVYYAFPIYCLAQPERDMLIINSVNWLLPRYTLTVYSVPTGVTFTVEDVPYMTPWSETNSEGTSVSLEMPEIHTFGNATYYWNQWSDGITGRSRTVTMYTDITLTAQYARAQCDLAVSLIAPPSLPLGGSAILKATVYNGGLSNETDVELQLLIDGSRVADATIPELINGSSHTLNYIWTPTVAGIYNVTAYTPPVPDENITINNIATKMVRSGMEFNPVADIQNPDSQIYMDELVYEFDSPPTEVGDKFNVIVIGYNISRLFAYQVVIDYDATLLSCLNAWPDGGGWTDPDWIFYDLQTWGLTWSSYADAPSVGRNAELVGDSLKNAEDEVSLTDPAGEALLARFEFEILAVPEPYEEVSCVIGITSSWASGTFVQSTEESAALQKRSPYLINSYFNIKGIPPLLSDLDEDGFVTIADISIAAVAFGSFPGHPRWIPIADLDMDGVVTISDIAKIAVDFGKTI